jgi:predicted TPR repeat methyltransferase
MIDHDFELENIYQSALSKRDYVTMLAALEQGVATAALPAPLYLRIAEICEKDLGDIYKARDALRRVCDLDPNDVATRARLDALNRQLGDR